MPFQNKEDCKSLLILVGFLCGVAQPSLGQLKKSIKNKQTIYDLATELLKDTECSVTVAMCARVALLVSMIHWIFVQYTNYNSCSVRS